MNTHRSTVRGRIATDDKRFSFGANWSDFIKAVDEPRITGARESIQALLGVKDLKGLRFLDVGCGSGLLSLAARSLGAKVHSFDYDPQSVASTIRIKESYLPGDDGWSVEQGSVLDEDYLSSLGTFDIVYAWGVLHHTGAMWPALDTVRRCVKPGGRLCVALYNDQGWVSRYWRGVKRIYNRGWPGRMLMILVHAPYLMGARMLVRIMRGALRLPRGMSLWHDMLDWLGGYPFEVAKPADVLGFYESRGLKLARMHTCGRRHGCNEFVFMEPGAA